MKKVHTSVFLHRVSHLQGLGHEGSDLRNDSIHGAKIWSLLEGDGTVEGEVRLRQSYHWGHVHGGYNLLYVLSILMGAPLFAPVHSEVNSYLLHRLPLLWNSDCQWAQELSLSQVTMAKLSETISKVIIFSFEVVLFLIYLFAYLKFPPPPTLLFPSPSPLPLAL